MEEFTVNILECQPSNFADPYRGAVTLEQLQEQHTARAFQKCEAVGLIPSGFLGALLYPLLRAALWEFLKWMVKIYYERKSLVPSDGE